MVANKLITFNKSIFNIANEEVDLPVRKMMTNNIAHRIPFQDI